jgi:hypothetical protein
MLVLGDKRYFKQNEAKDRKRIIQHENLAVIVITTLKQRGKNVRDMHANLDILACYNVDD